MGTGWSTPLPTTPIDPPTISINVFANDSPLAGKEGTKLTSQLIKDRIYEEAQTNVVLTVLPGLLNPWSYAAAVFSILVFF
jgi:predicted membrane GTPase involved in stress response